MRAPIHHHRGVDDAVAFVPQAIEIQLRDGRRLEQRVEVLKGHARRPLTREEVLAKFRACCGFAARPVSTERADAIIAAVDRLEELADVRELGDLLAL